MRHAAFAVLALLCSCAAPTPTPPAKPSPFAAPPLAMDALLAMAPASPTAFGIASASDAPARRAHVRVVHADSACKARGGNPVLVPPDCQPVVGQPFRLAWQLATVAPAHPAASVSALVALRPLDKPLPLDSWGYAGCRLQLAPSWSVPALPMSSAAALVYDPGSARGRVLFQWTPTADWIERSLYVQILVVEPSGATHLSALVEIHCGT
jgi:hypothetical protein